MVDRRADDKTYQLHKELRGSTVTTGECEHPSTKWQKGESLYPMEDGLLAKSG